MTGVDHNFIFSSTVKKWHLEAPAVSDSRCHFLGVRWHLEYRLENFNTVKKWHLESPLLLEAAADDKEVDDDVDPAAVALGSRITRAQAVYHDPHAAATLASAAYVLVNQGVTDLIRGMSGTDIMQPEPTVLRQPRLKARAFGRTLSSIVPLLLALVCLLAGLAYMPLLLQIQQ